MPVVAPFRRWCRHHVRSLLANFVLVSSFVPVVVLPNLSATTLTGPPLMAFATSGATPIAWSAASYESVLNNVTVSGAPSVLAGQGLQALGARTATGDLVLYKREASGATSLVDLTTSLPSPAPSASPVVFFDPWNNVDVAYIATNGSLVVLAPTTALQPHLRHRADRLRSRLASAYDVITVVPTPATSFAAGTPSVSVLGTSATIVATSATHDIVATTVNWTSSNQAPTTSTPLDVTAASQTATIQGEPTMLPSTTTTSLFCATLTNGDIALFQASGAGTWATADLSATTNAPTSLPGLSTATNGTTTFIAAATAGGHVQLFSVPVGQELASMRRARIITQPSSTWTYLDLTSATIGAPTIASAPLIDTTPHGVTIGAVATTGDLLTLSATDPTSTWTLTDLSRTASNAAITVGPAIASVVSGSAITIFAYQAGYIATTGVGLYAIPQADWGRAITDGWPILSDTGGLGTYSAPWVGFVTSGGVAQSPDFLLGQVISNAHRAETWLSFWTVSGPLSAKQQSVATYYTHGYDAGAWVAQQVTAYRQLGDTATPNWVILDPEGLPDNHSFLDAPPGASAATMAVYASYWSAMLRGWAAGMASVNPKLRPGVYASMSEYRNYGLVNLSMPVFEAVAFSGGGPVQIPGSTGSNILGYIAFSAVCTPHSALAHEIATLKGAPWYGQFNTLQFDAGVYCAP